LIVDVNNISTKDFICSGQCSVYSIHRYIISLSSSRSCLPPCQCLQSLPVFRFQSASTLAPEALTSDPAASASSSTPVLPASYCVSSEQITASEALLVLQEGLRTSQSSLLVETIPEIQDISQTQHFSRDDEFIIT